MLTRRHDSSRPALMNLARPVLALCFCASALDAQARPRDSTTMAAAPETVWVDVGDGKKVHLDAAHVAIEGRVEQRPVILFGPALTYPDFLRQTGVQGRVLVQAIIDTTGRAEPGSVRIVHSPHPGFDDSAREYMLRAQFRPARIHGRAVRVLVNVPIDYKIGSPLSPFDVRQP